MKNSGIIYEWIKVKPPTGLLAIKSLVQQTSVWLRNKKCNENVSFRMYSNHTFYSCLALIFHPGGIVIRKANIRPCPQALGALNFQILDRHWLCPEKCRAKPFTNFIFAIEFILVNFVICIRICICVLQNYNLASLWLFDPHPVLTDQFPVEPTWWWWWGWWWGWWKEEDDDEDEDGDVFLR